MEDIIENSVFEHAVEDDDRLFAKYNENPTADNRNEIVNKYLYLSEIISKKFLNRGIDYEDIYQVASIALIKAVERFSVDKGVKFVSFATPTIIGEIKRFFRDKGSVIRVPRRIYEVYQKVNHAREHLSQELHRVPKVEEIAKYLNISEETVLEITESWNAYNMQSFDQNIYAEDDLELHETIGSEDTTFERIENRDFLEKSLDKFNQAEKEFIKMRYFSNKTQKEIADKLGVSQMYISRMEKKVLEKFRKILSK
ncbi:MAG: SigB/SigF/SigG family RNA polymerase sigma factor [Clostridia bacterium]|nr:SigB/SigF/SigG family RNA polymerase sigma factor [Clostridia bacterium]